MPGNRFDIRVGTTDEHRWTPIGKARIGSTFIRVHPRPSVVRSSSRLDAGFGQKQARRAHGQADDVRPAAGLSDDPRIGAGMVGGKVVGVLDAVSAGLAFPLAALDVAVDLRLA